MEETSQVSTEALESAAPIEQDVGGLTEESNTAQVASVVEEYQPNYKYKVLDKEFEFDEDFKGVVKSKALEDKLRDLYTKSSGIDHVKQERDQFRTKYQDYEKHLNSLLEVARPVQHYVEKKDIDNLLPALGLNKQDVLKWTLKQLEIDDLPQQYKEQYSQIPSLQSENFLLKQQMEQFRQMEQQQQHASIMQRYEQTLAKPDVKNIVEQFEAKNGAGSFTEEIKMRGLAHYNQHGKDADPEQLVNDFVNRIMFAQASQPQQQTQTISQNANTPKPVIPVVKGSGSSVVAKKAKSLAELRAQREKYSY